MPSFTMSGSHGGLAIDVMLSHPYSVRNPVRNPVRVNAILDTGAIRTMVNDTIAEALNLPLVNVVPVNSVKSTNFHPVFMTRVQIPMAQNTPVTDAGIISVLGGLSPVSAQCIIGMDILSHSLFIYNGPANTFTLSF